MLNWDINPEDRDLCAEIGRRASALARKAGIKYPIMDATMDIEAVHLNGMPLRLADLRDADDFNFSHDVFGIRRHIDRDTGQLTGCFLPRFHRRIQTAVDESEKAIEAGVGA